MKTDWTKEQRIEFLRENPGFWTRLGLVPSPPIVEEGKLVCLEDVELNVQRHKSLYEQGIILHSFILPLGWIGVDKYDYEQTDRILASFFRELPNVYLLPRIKLDAPIEWLLENPEETFVFENGPTDVEKIKESVEASRHPVYGAILDGLTGLQSFSSKKWLQDAGKALTKLLLHLQKSPYSNRILGYHLAYGCCGETTLWGSWEKDWTHRGDFGISATRAFSRYAKDKGYGFNTVPSLCERYAFTGLQNIHNTKEGEIYSRFLSDVNVNAMESFAKTAKQIEPQKPIGYFYGYQLEVSDCSHAGHAGLDRVLQSSYIDFLAGPKGYYRVSPYDPGIGEAPTQSISLKKLWIDELDNRTHLCKDTDEKAQGASNLEQTKSVYWREFTKNLSKQQGFWFMDLGGGWFEDVEILQEVKRIVSENSRLRNLMKGAKSFSEVLLVYDEQFFHEVKTEKELYHTLLPKSLAVMKECGAPIDIYRLSDLEKLSLEKYKVIVFLNCIAVETRQLSDILSKFNEQANIVWQYAPGLITDEKYDINNVRFWTGIGIEEVNNEQYSYPTIKISTTTTNVLKKNFNGDSIMAYSFHNGRKNILNAMPDMLTVEDFRSILEDAGVHLYSTAYSTVQATDAFLYIMSGKDIKTPIHLKEARRCKEVFSNRVFEKCVSLEINVTAGTGIFIEYID